MWPISKIISTLSTSSQTTTAPEPAQEDSPVPLNPSVNSLKSTSENSISLKKISDSFTKGDLIYGRSDKRQNYYDEILNKQTNIGLEEHLSEYIQEILEIIYNPNIHVNEEIFHNDTLNYLTNLSLNSNFLHDDLNLAQNIKETILKNIHIFQEYYDNSYQPNTREKTNVKPPRYMKFIQSREEILGKRVFISEFNRPILNSKIEPEVKEADDRSTKRLKLIGKVTLAEKHLDIPTVKYLTALKATKYNPKNLGVFEISDLIKNDVHITNNTLSDLSKEKQIDLLGVQAIRRACKFGMIYAPVYLKQKIHYVLDDIANDSLTEKQNFLLHVGTTGVPITTSEVRFLFRNWHAILEHGLDKQILFYDQMQTTTPPWVKEPDAWSSYAEQRINKHESSLKPEEIIKFKEHYLTENHTEALHAFFKMKFENPIDPAVASKRGKI